MTFDVIAMILCVHQRTDARNLVLFDELQTLTGRTDGRTDRNAPVAGSQDNRDDDEKLERLTEADEMRVNTAIQLSYKRTVRR